jgi:hypothetical protein
LVDAVVEVLKAVLLALVAFSLLSTLLSHVFTWYYFASYDRRFPTKGQVPPVSVIKPTKGVDQSALENFRSFCEQDYPNDYEVLFCVEGDSDPSVPVIRRIMQEYPHVDVRVVFSDPEDTGSVGKMKNMIAGYAASSYDVIVFSDSDAFFEERDLIPDGQFHEIRFEDLERDPVAEMRGLYERLGIPGFEAFRPALENYVRSNSNYRKNEYQKLPSSLRREISQAWRRSFDEWNYPCD